MGQFVGIFSSLLVGTVTRTTIRLNGTATWEIVREARSACTVTGGSWRCVVWRCFASALKDTLASKKRTVSKLGRAVRSTGKRYCQNGLGTAAKDDCERLKALVESLPSKCRAVYGSFRALTRVEQQDEVLDLILTWIIFWAAAGGSDLEGGLPDTDLAFGIEDHRSLLSHTVLLGLGAELSMRFGAALFKEICLRLPERHSKAWDSAYEFVEKHKNAPITGMWAGIGVHFLKDANLISHATKPYVGLPHSMPMDLHQAFFAANGAASEAVAFVRE